MTTETNWTETPEMDRYGLTDDATPNQRDIFDDARNLYRQSHFSRKQALEGEEKYREQRLSYADGEVRQAERKLSILRRKGVLIER